ncbi:hypothetical protein AB0F20_10250 [Streptomyces goshikiensis]|uniref:hypothetical protein n=1 Tax=Streptomyces goshikiensis TaxID=1942 RepID=UPI0033E71FD0
MTSRSNEQALARKQRLREQQRRQLKVLDQVARHENKLAAIDDDKERKIAAIEKDAAQETAVVEREMAKTIVEAVDAFGSQPSAAEQLGLTLGDIRRYLSQDKDGQAETTADVQTPDAPVRAQEPAAEVPVTGAAGDALPGGAGAAKGAGDEEGVGSAEPTAGVPAV